jgi:signal transduction histidine kinase
MYNFCAGIIENYFWQRDVILDEYQLYQLDSVVFSASLVVSLILFITLFLILFGERLAYIRTIIKGIDALRDGEYGRSIDLVGNNELTQLAIAVNYLSESELKIKEKETRLKEEKEELIRTLSHDIRTPLTSILSYSEIMEQKEGDVIDEQREYVSLVHKKALQIKDLTYILLDGGKRNVERFDGAKLLFEQLAGEFEEVLEDGYRLDIDLSECPEFSGDFDVQEMRRIFDNLISNIQKYADPDAWVVLSVKKTEIGLIIRQSNAIKKTVEPSESYRMGINSIRRIAQSYGGQVNINQNEELFEIVITLSQF